MTEAASLPALVRDGMGWAWEPGFGVRMRVDRLINRSGETVGEVEILSAGKHMHLANLNLCSTTSRAGLAKLLATRTNGAGVPWETFVEQFSVGVLRKDREGEPTRYTFDAPIPPTRYLIDQVVQQGKPNLLFGPGGGSKGYLAVAMSVGVTVGHGVGPLSVARATPLYLDWEDDFETFNNRVKRVSGGWDLPVSRVAYRRMKGLLPDRVNEVARAVRDAAATFGIVDSVSACCGSPRTGETWDAIAHRLFDALDLIPSGVPDQPMTWLLIGHVTGDAARGTSPAGRMFGSIQQMNRARCAWEVRSEQAPGAPTVRTTLYHAKWNHTGAKPPIRLELAFEGDALRIAEALPPEPDAQKTRLLDRLIELLAHRDHQAIGALAIGTGEKADTVRKQLIRYEGRHFERDEDGHWSLIPDDEKGLPWR